MACSPEPCRNQARWSGLDACEGLHGVPSSHEMILPEGDGVTTRLRLLLCPAVEERSLKQLPVVASECGENVRGASFDASRGSCDVRARGYGPEIHLLSQRIGQGTLIDELKKQISAELAEPNWRLELQSEGNQLSLQQSAVAVDEICRKKQQDTRRGLMTPRSARVDGPCDRQLITTPARQRSKASFGDY